ncbi:MAG: protein kinase, partial [Acidobacteriia bacterium]|nr:protein kinase [Terriglobia bacterium]
YRILGRLGEGGMAVVYKAEDLRLGRIVALKTLLDVAFPNDRHRERFLREARAIAALDHPHICTLYEVLELEGRLYLAMNFAAGGSLAERLRVHSFSVAEAMEVAIQIAEGLGEAHRHGIVHRDVKPANILLTESGMVKIADFGLAQSRSNESLTLAGAVVGTPAFMAPEQWLGEPVDARTDIWGLGVVLYMMLAGRAPFQTEGDRSIGNAILSTNPAPVSAFRSTAGPGVDQLISEVLAKNISARPASMKAVVDRLRRLQFSPAAFAGSAEDESTKTLYDKPRADSGSQASLVSKLSVAVLPFTCREGDEESDYFSEGLSEELISELSRVKSLRVISRTSSFQFRGPSVDPIAVGARLSAARLVCGSVRRSASRLRISIELINTTDASAIWSQVYHRETKDLFSVQDEIFKSIGNALHLQLETEGQPRAHNNLEAYGLFLLGLQHLRQRSEGEIRKACEVFERAISIDPQMAAAHSGLSTSKTLLAVYGWDSPRESLPAAARAAQTAIGLDPTQADALVTLGFVAFFHDWNPAEAERQLQAAIKLAPSNVVARSWYAVILMQLGRFAEAEKKLREAESLDPMSLPIQHNLAWLRVLDGRPKEAVALCGQVARIDPTYRRIGYFLSMAHAELGEWTLAAEAVREMASLESIPEMAQLGVCYAALGDRARAQRMVDRLAEIAPGRYVSPMEPCYVLAALGDLDDAFACLETAVRERAPALMFYRVDQRLNPLRNDPRFASIVARLG